MSFFSDLVKGNFGNLGTDISHDPWGTAAVAAPLLLGGGALLAPGILAGLGGLGGAAAGAGAAGGEAAALGGGEALALGGEAALPETATLASGDALAGSLPGFAGSAAGDFVGATPLSVIGSDFGALGGDAFGAGTGTIGGIDPAAITSAESFAENSPAFSGFNQTGGLFDASGFTPAPGVGDFSLPAASQLAEGTVPGVGPSGVPGVGASSIASPTTTAGAAAGGGNPLGGFGDFISKNPALAASLGIGAAGSLLSGQLGGFLAPKVPQQKQLQGVADSAQQQNQANLETENQLMSGILTGQIPAGAQAALDQATSDAKNTIKARYAKLGMTGSSAEADALAYIDQQAAGQKFQVEQQMAQTALQAGSQAVADLGVESSIYTTLLNAQVQQDTALSQSISNFAGMAAYATAIGSRATAPKAP